MFYSNLVKEPREPKDPPLITNFLNRLKRLSILKLSKSDDLKEKSLNLAKKKFMSSNLEDKLLEGKAKEFAKEKRLNLSSKKTK